MSSFAVNEFKVKFFPRLDHESLTEEEIENFLNSMCKGGWSVQLVNVHVRRDNGSTMIVIKRWRREEENRIRTDRDEMGEEPTID